MKYEIETLESLPCTTLINKGAYGENNKKLMEKMKEYAKSKDIFNEDTVIYGIALDNPNEIPSEQCRYEVALVVDSFKNHKLNNKYLNLGKYAMFLVDHTPEAVKEFYESLQTILSVNNLNYDSKRLIIEKYHMKQIKKHKCEIGIPLI